MLAVVAAVFFGLALLIDLLSIGLGSLSTSTFLFAGLLCLALHAAGIGGPFSGFGTSTTTRRRRR